MELGPRYLLRRFSAGCSCLVLSSLVQLARSIFTGDGEGCGAFPSSSAPFAPRRRRADRG